MRLFALGILLFFALLAAKLFQLQILQGKTYAQQARSQQTSRVPLDSRRGSIVDRSGHELAVDLPQFYTLGVYPDQVNNNKVLCQELAGFTNRPASHYVKRLQSPSKFVYLEWRLTAEQSDRLRALGVGGLNLRKSTGRFYPYHRSTSQLLGYTDVDGRGIAGIEVLCDSVLQGKQGWETHQRDARGLSIWDPLRGCDLPKDGGTVRLSIDIIAQEVLHQELLGVRDHYRAQWAGGILMNPKTGEILAICSVPDFDPLRPETGSQAHHKLRPVTDLFEPGSVYKIVAAAAALDRGILQAGDSIYCEEGAYRLANKILRDVHPHGWLSFEDVLVYSSNIGMAKVAEMVGSKEIYRYGVRFGFGNPLGVEYPGEAQGFLRPYDAWNVIDRANIAMGQGVSVTMLQMAMAFAAIANDGILMEPRLIQNTTDSDGQRQSYPPREIRRVMEPKTARTLQRILTQVVERGTGQNAAIAGLQIAGKTGTAQLPDLVHGGYYQDRFIASFVGFLPADDADRLLIISVCDPKGAHFGSQVSAPVFKKVMQRLLPADAIRKSWEATPQELAAVQGGLHQDVSLLRMNDAMKRLGGQYLSDISHKDSRDLDERTPDPKVVPDLKGLSLRQAVSRLSKLGIKVKIEGKGWVVRQSLRPGTPIKKNSVCILKAKP